MELYSAGKASEADRLEIVGPLIRSRQPGGLQHPNPSALSDLPKEGIILPTSVDDHYQQLGFSVALASKMGRHRRLVYTTMGDVETVVVHAMLKWWLFIRWPFFLQW